MANEYIGRRSSFGLAKETTAGTAGATYTYIPMEKVSFQPVPEKIRDGSSYGVIDENYSSITVKQMTELETEGIARELSIGHILLAAFGTVAAPSLVETGVYSHVFTRKNDNSPVTYTVGNSNPVGGERSTYNVLDTFELEAKAADYVRVKTKWKGRKIETGISLTPAFTDENLFTGVGVVVKFASNLAWLTGATAVSLKSARLSIEKNVTDVVTLGSDDVDTLHNQQFSVTGEFEAIFRDLTFLDAVRNSTKQAMSITIAGKDLIGATKKAELKFTMPRVSLEDWKRSDDANGIVTQTFGFVAEFSAADAYTISSALQNTRATTY